MSDNLSVRIRMYCQGIGDCFLITFTSKGSDPFHMLIDCGVLLGTKDADILMKTVVDNIFTETKGTLDLLVVTHEHWDHVSGFKQASTTWDKIVVKQVWSAWTEKKGDTLAQGLRATIKKNATLLRKAIENGSGRNIALNEEIANVLDFFGAAVDGGGSLATREALDYALSKSPGTDDRFLEPGTWLDMPGVAGVRVYVLGPPRGLLLTKADPSARNPEVYTLDSPMTLADSYFAARGLGLDITGDGSDPGLPFDDQCGITMDAAHKDDFFKTYYFGEDSKEDATWRQIEDDWLGLASELALYLDDFTNNSSLALAIELVESKRVLLFPGDAQVGNWLSWHDYTWKVPDASGQLHDVNAINLLNRTSFYKVGHHGSHNATLKEKGLEEMGKLFGLTAMIPVDEEVAKTRGKKGWEMPFKTLRENLEAITAGRLIRADRDLVPIVGLPVTESPETFPADDQGRARRLYYEYKITV